MYHGGHPHGQCLSLATLQVARIEASPPAERARDLGDAPSRLEFVFFSTCDRLPGDGVGQLQLHRLVGKQSQGPCAAGHGHQVGFLIGPCRSLRARCNPPSHRWQVPLVTGHHRFTLRPEPDQPAHSLGIARHSPRLPTIKECLNYILSYICLGPTTSRGSRRG